MPEEKVRCSLWTYRWSQRMPTWVVDEMIKKGIINKKCVHPEVKPYLKERIEEKIIV